MMAYIVRLIIIFVVVWAAFRLWRALQGPARPGFQGGAKALVRCAHCGTYVPRNEAVMVGEEPYCSPEHRDAAKKGAEQ